MSVEFKGTPGPWEVVTERGYDAYVIPADSTDDAICRANGNANNKEIMANARLMAAAPDLLAALRAMRQRWDVYTHLSVGHTDDALMRNADAAIAKALQL